MIDKHTDYYMEFLKWTVQHRPERKINEADMQTIKAFFIHCRRKRYTMLCGSNVVAVSDYLDSSLNCTVKEFIEQQQKWQENKDDSHKWIDHYRKRLDEDYEKNEAKYNRSVNEVVEFLFGGDRKEAASHLYQVVAATKLGFPIVGRCLGCFSTSVVSPSNLSAKPSHRSSFFSA